jgi:hypothetical protein
VSSKRRLRRRACERKVPHKSWAAARWAADRHGTAPNDGSLTIVIYQCPFAEHWHTGHGKAAARERLLAVRGCA